MKYSVENLVFFIKFYYFTPLDKDVTMIVLASSTKVQNRHKIV